MNNYFNYFTEVEEYFVRRRGKNLLVSPLDWCLIELWRDSGIPLHVVLRGIDRSFGMVQKGKKRSPRSLFYCHSAILDAFEEYKQAMVGASEEKIETEDPTGFSKEGVQGHLQSLMSSLELHTGEVFERSGERIAALKSEIDTSQRVNYQELDRDLAEISVLLVGSLKEEMGVEKFQILLEEAKEQTRIYRKRLSKEMYQRLENRYLERRIQQYYDLPEFSLLGVQD